MNTSQLAGAGNYGSSSWEEIAALTKYQEEVKKRGQELVGLQKQEAMEKEREEMGIIRGMSE